MRHALDRQTRRGIFCMLAGMVFTVLQVALVKFSTQSISLSQVIFATYTSMAATLWAIGLVVGMPLPTIHLKNRSVTVLAGLDALALVPMWLGYAHLPLANATAIAMTSPLIMVIFAVLIFGQVMSVRRWLVVIVSFGGVLLIVQPTGDGFSMWSLVMLLGAFLAALRDVLTRSVGKEVTSVQLSLISAAFIAVGSTAGALFEPWRSLSAQEAAALVAAGTFLAIAYVLVTFALREGDVTTIGQFRYVRLIFAAMLGYAVWGDVPNALAACGIVLIVAAGMQMFRVRD